MTEMAADRTYDVVIAGAGPAGASLAIRLASQGFDVCLIEREVFPRHKLCGEFISPECLGHFSDLGVLGEMVSAGGDRIGETVFYSTGGRSVSVDSSWFGDNGAAALSLSRAEMDLRLMRRAEGAGANVIAGCSVSSLNVSGGRICSAAARTAAGERTEIRGRIFVDATGRARVLTKLAARCLSPGGDVNRSRRSLPGIIKGITGRLTSGTERLVGFKTHFDGVDLEKGRCEIYFFPGGYGGLSFVENGTANHCFLVRADAVRGFGGDVDSVLRELVFRNKRARRTLKNARRKFKWYAVSVDSFGTADLAPADNLFAIGDSAAFIDPFTGSGMLMALESAELLAGSLIRHSPAADLIREEYPREHAAKFRRRLRVCAALRRLCFVPSFANAAIFALGFSSASRQLLTRGTRSGAAPRRV